MKILVVVAHPDDEVLGMGGTIKKLSKNKNEIKIAIMATGIAARRSINFKNSSKYNVNKTENEIIIKQINTLRLHATKSAKILGVRDIEFLNYPDNEMDKVSNLELTKSVERIIHSFKPEVVYTHTPFDVNVDHIACYRAVLTATRPKKNTIVDITHEIKNKIKALQAYKTESEKYPHPRSTKALQAIGNRWGTVSGFSVAEAFFLVRSLED